MGFCGSAYGMGGMMPMGMILIGLILYFAFSNRNRFYVERSRVNNNSALRILNERYASGEISYEEFDRMRRNIG